MSAREDRQDRVRGVPPMVSPEGQSAPPCVAATHQRSTSRGCEPHLLRHCSQLLLRLRLLLRCERGSLQSKWQYKRHASALTSACCCRLRASGVLSGGVQARQGAASLSPAPLLLSVPRAPPALPQTLTAEGRGAAASARDAATSQAGEHGRLPGWWCWCCCTAHIPPPLSSHTPGSAAGHPHRAAPRPAGAPARTSRLQFRPPAPPAASEPPPSAVLHSPGTAGGPPL
jgi:hypothetical protein